MARLLVVDDDASIRQLLVYALSMEGHSVETLPDGRDVVQRLRASPERVVALMDVMMPHVTGLDVLRSLADEPELLARHAIVLMSAGFTPGAPCPDGARDTLPKPFDLRRALDLVERLSAETVTPREPKTERAIGAAPVSPA